MNASQGPPVRGAPGVSRVGGLPPELGAVFTAAGAAAWGAVAYARIAPLMSPENRDRAQALCPGAATAFVAAFPYYAGERPGNLSLYARGADYHPALVRRLTPVCDFLRGKYPEYSFLPAADSSPLPEREIAWLAGLGLRGENGLFILPPWGSYLFLGTILTDAPFDPPPAQPAPACLGCGKCRRVCPTGALGGIEQTFHVKQCLSDLTQRKGDLTGEEAALLRAHPYVWGCDLCQRCCPYNAAPRETELPEFRENLTDFLTAGMLEGLTNRAFRARYGGRAFAWRGPAVLRRNLAVKDE